MRYLARRGTWRCDAHRTEASRACGLIEKKFLIIDIAGSREF